MTTVLEKNFGVIGVGGYIAPRHIKAIYATHNRVVVALDPNDSVGYLDRYDHNIAFFTEPERFDRHLEKLHQGNGDDAIHYVSVCSPNYLHDAHIRMALRAGADVICEKPLVINPWNLDLLQGVEAKTNQRINVVLQLRVHPSLVALRERLQRTATTVQHEVNLTYVTARGRWYDRSWKGNPEKSGGISVNIGIHFFDLLGWLFGNFGESRVYLSEAQRMSGYIEFERAKVRWFLSVDRHDLPFPLVSGQNTTLRSITVDGEEVEFSEGFTDLHTRIYEQALAGQGFGVDDIRPATELTHIIRTATAMPIDDRVHPWLRK